MIQQQKIRDIKGRLIYLKKEGKYSKDSLEFMGSVPSPKWNQEIFETLDKDNGVHVPKEFIEQNKTQNEQEKKKFRNKDRTYIAAREIIVPIPHCLAKDLMGQRNFINYYMDTFKKYTCSDDSFVWCGFIHNKLSDNGTPKNFHAHIIFSERPLLDQPIIKHFKKRYLNKKGKICSKSEAAILPNGKLFCMPAYDKKVYFDNKKSFFKTQKFCKFCDSVWRFSVNSLGLMSEKDLEEIFIPDGMTKTLHVGNEHKKEYLSKKHPEKLQDILDHNELAIKEFKKYKAKKKEQEQENSKDWQMQM